MKIIYALSSAFVVGVFATIQAVVNARLGNVAGLPSLGGAFCYLTGLTLMLLGIIIHAYSKKLAIFRFSSEKPPTFFDFFGGICGGLYMTAAVYFSPMLGAALFFSLAIVGQLTSACLCDHFGFGGLPISRITPSKTLALSIAIAGVVVSAMGESGHSSSENTPDHYTNDVENVLGLLENGQVNIRPFVRLIICGVVMLAGAVQPIQATLNWRLSLTLPHKSQAMAFSFFFAWIITTGLSVAVLLFGTKNVKDVFNGFVSAPWYAYIGGPLQGAVVAGGIFIPSRIGTALYYCILLTGELVCSLIVDMVGGFGMPKRGFNVASFSGVCIVIVASISMQNAAKLDKLIVKYFSWMLPCINKLIGAEITKELYESVIPEDEKEAEVVASVVAGVSCISSFDTSSKKDALLADYDPIDYTLPPKSPELRPSIDIFSIPVDAEAHSSSEDNMRSVERAPLPPRSRGSSSTNIRLSGKYGPIRSPINSRQFGMLHGKYLIPLPADTATHASPSGYNSYTDPVDPFLRGEDSTVDAVQSGTSQLSPSTNTNSLPSYPKVRSPVNSGFSSSAGLPPLPPLTNRGRRSRGNTFNLDTSFANKEFWSLPPSSLTNPTPSILQQDALENAIPVPSLKETLQEVKGVLGSVVASVKKASSGKRSRASSSNSQSETLPISRSYNSRN